MFKQLPLRFSLLSLLLVTTLVCVSVSHFCTSLRLSLLDARFQSLQRTLREANDRLGVLTVDDPSMVHVIARGVPDLDNLTLPWGRFGFGWEMHIPPGKPFRLCWSSIDIPPWDFPVARMGEKILNVTADRRASLSIEFPEVVNPATDRGLVHIDDRAASNESKEQNWQQIRVTQQNGIWLDEIECEFEMEGGDCQWGNVFTRSFSPDEPIVLLRIRRIPKPPLATFVQDVPCRGFMVWLEPVKEAKATNP